MVYDSIAGPDGALRWHEAGDWKRFELIREVADSGEFTLKLLLTGLGEVQFDDIRIVTHKPSAPATMATVTAKSQRSLLPVSTASSRSAVQAQNQAGFQGVDDGRKPAGN